MNVYASRYGVTIDGKHTFRDFHMLPTTPPVIEPPEPVIYTVQVPGMDGELDMSESLTGHVQFGMRSGHMGYLLYCPRERWYVTYRELLEAFHGQMCDVVLDEEPDVKYRGRLQITEVNFDGKSCQAQITIEGTFYPWPTETSDASRDWLWDPFNFETGTLDEYFLLGQYTIDKNEIYTASVTISSSQVTGNPLLFVWDGGTAVRADVVKSDGTTVRRLTQKNVWYDDLGWSADSAGTLSIEMRNTYHPGTAITISVYARRTTEAE